MFTSHTNAHQNLCPEHGYPWYPVDSVRRLLSHQCSHTGPMCKVAMWAVEAPHSDNRRANSPQGDLAVDCTQCPNQQRQRPTLSLLWRLSTAGLPRTHPTLEQTELSPHSVGSDLPSSYSVLLSTLPFGNLEDVCFIATVSHEVLLPARGHYFKAKEVRQLTPIHGAH